MEDTKMIAEDVIEERNGVYGDKWHIVSPEGFDLPEGLEYLKNSWERDTQKYKANIMVENISLKTALEKLHCVLHWTEAMKCIVKIINDGERKEGTNFFKTRITSFLDEFVIHRCHLTPEDITDVLLGGIPEGFCCNFSDNMFITKDFSLINKFESCLNNIEDYENRVALLDLRYCNFSNEEKEFLKNKLRCCNLLI